MEPVTPLSAVLSARVREAATRALPQAPSVDPQVRRSEHADFQANGILPLAKPLRSNPRTLATLVAASLELDGFLRTAEVSGPGFLNLTVSDRSILAQIARRMEDPRLGISEPESGRVTVIDYSQPNIAKEMHVGHLRSTILGDALARVLSFLGGTVIRQNHIGDWGTQFGMLIQYLIESADADLGTADGGSDAMSRLNRLYRSARARFDAEPDFAERSRKRVVALQAGDQQTVALWREIVAESKRYFEEVYARLDVLLVDDDAVGESFYNSRLPAVAQDLERGGVATHSDGALCVFFDDIVGPDGNRVPLIVQKRDGGFGYAATDLAAVRYRVGELSAGRILYVVDARQALHFRMVLTTARRAGWLPDSVEAIHVGFGTVLGPDGRPFKTRAGEVVRLISLLDEAIDRAHTTVREKNPELPETEAWERARELGIGAVKYADLSTSRTRDYMFDLDRMVSLQGNTGLYLQYAHARVCSILRRAPNDGPEHPDLNVELEPAERALALHLDELSEAVIAVSREYEPHRLSHYLFNLAQLFTDFYETCPVLKAPDPGVRNNRLLLCRATGASLRLGLRLLGIAAPERL